MTTNAKSSFPFKNTGSSKLKVVEVKLGPLVSTFILEAGRTTCVPGII